MSASATRARTACLAALLIASAAVGATAEPATAPGTRSIRRRARSNFSSCRRARRTKDVPKFSVTLDFAGDDRRPDTLDVVVEMTRWIPGDKERDDTLRGAGPVRRRQNIRRRISLRRRS